MLLETFFNDQPVQPNPTDDQRLICAQGCVKEFKYICSIVEFFVSEKNKLILTLSAFIFPK